ncbi:MAG: GatB/YqeY domain-containing protein [Bacteroidales bacterium]|nr:GatB/YqeY domain-containing protein [Bacteroidales bacterium]
MGLFEKVSDDIKAAMLARQKDRLEALRAVKTAFMLAKTETGIADLPADQELKILQKMIKQRKESAEIYKSQNRMDLYKQEVDEAAVIAEYLPRQMNEEEIVQIIKRIVQEVGAISLKDMGKVMSVASKELSGKADNKMIADKVKEILAGM